MRREDGLYVGIPECRYYAGLDSVKEKTCCGGKKYPVAFIKCISKGIIESEPACTPGCPVKEYDFAKARR